MVGDTAPGSPGAAVVGAGGFVGAHLCDALRDAGSPVARFDRAHPVVVDGELAPAARDALTVFHLASGVDLASAADDPRRAHRDVELLDDLLAALARVPRPGRTVVLTSSALVYAPEGPRPVAETARTEATSRYTAVKLAMEARLLAAAGTIRPVVVRLAHVYGPGQHTGAAHGVVAHWLRAVRERGTVTVIGDENSERDFVHVADVVAALVRIHRASVRGAVLPTVLNVGGGTPVSLRELLGAVAAATGRTPTVDRRPARAFDRPREWLDVGRARTELGWTPTRTLAAGVAETAAAGIAPAAGHPPESPGGTHTTWTSGT